MLYCVLLLFLTIFHVSKIVPASSPISPAVAQLHTYDNDEDDWLLRLNRSTPEQLITWFENPQEPVNLITKNGLSLLLWVMNSEQCKQNPFIQQTLLKRADLQVDIKGTHKGDGGDTTLGVQIYTLLNTQPQNPAKSKERLRTITKLIDRGALIDNISDKTKKALLTHAASLNLAPTSTAKHPHQLQTTFENVFEYFAKA